MILPLLYTLVYDLLLVSVFVEVDRVMECRDRGVDASLSVSLYQSSPARHTEPRPGDLYKSEYQRLVLLSK